MDEQNISFLMLLMPPHFKEIKCVDCRNHLINKNELLP